MFGGGDRTFNLGFVLATADRWLITGAMASVGLVIEFRALRVGGFTPGSIQTRSSLRWAWHMPVC